MSSEAALKSLLLSLYLLAWLLFPRPFTRGIKVRVGRGTEGAVMMAVIIHTSIIRRKLLPSAGVHVVRNGNDICNDGGADCCGFGDM